MGYHSGNHLVYKAACYPKRDTDVEDAHRAIEAGAKAIVVSDYHGGRQNDESHRDFRSLDFLPDIIKKQDRGISQIRCVRNVERNLSKALALGAKAVLIGRPALYGLAVDGKDDSLMC